MKRLFKWVTLFLALSSTQMVGAQEVTQEQKNATATLVTQCLMSKLPANWEVAEVILTRADGGQYTIGNAALIKGSQQAVNVDMKGCDLNKQGQDLLRFQAVIPADEAKWNTLHLMTFPNGNYNVFTDIALARVRSKK
ncbi:MAG: hypothetical protein ACRCV6_00375 [Formosimonas sp.]